MAYEPFIRKLRGWDGPLHLPLLFPLPTRFSVFPKQRVPSAEGSLTCNLLSQYFEPSLCSIWFHRFCQRDYLRLAPPRHLAELDRYEVAELLRDFVPAKWYAAFPPKRPPRHDVRSIYCKSMGIRSLRKRGREPHEAPDELGEKNINQNRTI